MPHSLRARLLLAVGLGVAASLGAMGVVTSLGTAREFQQFLEMETEESVPPAVDLPALVARLQEHHAAQGSWQGLAALLAELREAAEGRHLLVTDAAGRMVAATDGALGPDDVREEPGGGLRIVRRIDSGGDRREEVLRVMGPRLVLADPQGNHVGSLHLLPAATEAATPPARFLRSANRWRWLALVAGGLLALAATAAVARQILGPVEQLTRAARRMADGDLGHRVPVASQDEVSELARAFNRMAESLERTERQRRQMVSDVAHDLRTPLTNIRGQLEAIEDGLLRPTPEVIASLHEETMFLTALVGDLQDLSLAEAGRLRLDPRPLSVAEEVDRVVAALRPAGAGPAVEVEIPALPPAFADPDRFRQVVRNLLTNALAHTPAGGRIRVAARQAGGEIEVSVQDTGPGIGPEHLPHVFERFYRADPSRGRASGGAGLGLAIVKHLVTVQNGRAWVDSRPGEGARFGFTVPRADGE